MAWIVIAEQRAQYLVPKPSREGQAIITGWHPLADAPMTIDEAHEAYDAGTHEIAQRKVRHDERNVTYQLVIKQRRKPIDRRPWFGFGPEKASRGRVYTQRGAA